MSNNSSNAGANPSWTNLYTNQRGEGIVQIGLPPLSPTQLQALQQVVKLYQAAQNQHLPMWIGEREGFRIWEFQLSRAGEPAPEPLIQGGGIISSADAGKLVRALGDTIVRLHELKLGAWAFPPQFCWKVGPTVKIIPVFWLPWVAMEMRRSLCVAPEISRVPQLGPPSMGTDIYTASALGYLALLGRWPERDCPALPSEFSPRLANWDAALDWGLRRAPSRRASDAKAWAATSPRELGWDVVTKPGRERSWALAAVLLLCFALCASIGWWWTGRPTRGFAHSIVRYARMNYEGARWQELTDLKPLLPDGEYAFTHVAGWDTGHLSFFATQRRQTLRFQLRGSTWSSHRFETAYDCTGYGAYLTAEEMIGLIPYQSNKARLLRWTDDQAAVTLGDNLTLNCTLHLLAPDQYAGAAGRDYWRWSEGKLLNNERKLRDQYIMTKTNEKAKCHGREMLTADVQCIVTLSSGRAIGLWGQENAAIVVHEDGQWRLSQELSYVGSGRRSSSHVPRAMWGQDEKNLVIVGGEKVIQLIDGKEHLRELDSKNMEFHEESLLAVWGRAQDDYHVVDTMGNVFQFNGERWVSVVRGPERKNVTGSENERARAAVEHSFHGFWVSPDGTVYGFTKKQAFLLR